MKNRPKVSIWCVTYNHEKYIRNALDGFIMQKTDFKFEIVIHDDASTDGTAHILREYEKEYPGLVHVIYQTENQFRRHDNSNKFFWNIMRRELQGEYIAWCEGDDYWIDDNKLQMQIDYMENHPDCIMTVHDAIVLDCRTGKEKRYSIIEGCAEKDLSPMDIIEVHAPTASYICKRDVLDMDGFFLEAGMVGDYPLQLFCMIKGKIHYFNKVMSMYRTNVEGSLTSRQKQDFFPFFKTLVDVLSFMGKYNKYTDGIYEQYIRRQITWNLSSGFWLYCGLPVEEFEDVCNRLDWEDRYRMSKYYIETKRIFGQHYIGPGHLGSGVVEVVKKSKYLLIWGAGNYGRLLAEQLHNNGIEYEGFIVSDEQNTDGAVLGKSVWRISELPYAKEEIGIIAAVGPRLKEEVLTAIHMAGGIQNYIYPFEFDIENLLRGAGGK